MLNSDEITTGMHSTLFIAKNCVSRIFLDDLYDNIARNQEKENRRKKRTQTIDQYEEHTYTGPSSALILFGENAIYVHNNSL